MSSAIWWCCEERPRAAKKLIGERESPVQGCSYGTVDDPLGTVDGDWGTLDGDWGTVGGLLGTLDGVGLGGAGEGCGEPAADGLLVRGVEGVEDKGRCAA